MGLHIFRGLSLRVDCIPRDIFWTKNTLVRGNLPVPACAPCRFAGERKRYHGTTRKFLNTIQTMQFSQSESLGYTLPYEISVEMRPRLGISTSKKSMIHPYGTMDILRCFKCRTRGSVFHQAKKAWKVTWKAILPLRLDHLLLDFIKAYGPDRAFSESAWHE